MTEMFQRKNKQASDTHILGPRIKSL